MVDVLARRDGPADHKDIRTGLESVLDHVRADAAGGRDEKLAACRILHYAITWLSTSLHRDDRGAEKIKP